MASINKPRRAIVNVVAGPMCLAEHECTKANHAAYAKKCGAEHIIIKRETAPAYGPSAKYLVNTVTSDYDQTLMLDVDTVVTKIAPNIFDEVDVGVWAAVSELGQLTHDPQWETRNQAEAYEICDAMAIPRMQLFTALNSGVLLLPRGSGDYYYAPSRPVPSVWVFEQLWLQLQIQRFELPFLSLDLRWNWCAGWPAFRRELDKAFVIHLAGQPNRAGQLPYVVRDYALNHPMDRFIQN